MYDNEEKAKDGDLPPVLYQVESGPSFTVTASEADLNRILHSSATDKRPPDVPEITTIENQTGNIAQSSHSHSEGRPVSQMSLRESDIDLITLVKTYRDTISNTADKRLEEAKNVDHIHQQIGSSYFQKKRQDLIPISILRQIREKILVIESSDAVYDIGDINENITVPNLKATATKSEKHPGLFILKEDKIADTQKQINVLAESLRNVTNIQKKTVSELRAITQESKKVIERYDTLYSITETTSGELVETVVAIGSLLLNSQNQINVKENEQILTIFNDFVKKVDELKTDKVKEVLDKLGGQQKVEVDSIDKSREEHVSKIPDKWTKSSGDKLDKNVSDFDIDLSQIDFSEDDLEEVYSESTRNVKSNRVLTKELCGQRNPESGQREDPDYDPNDADLPSNEDSETGRKRSQNALSIKGRSLSPSGNKEPIDDNGNGIFKYLINLVESEIKSHIFFLFEWGEIQRFDQ